MYPMLVRLVPGMFLLLALSVAARSTDPAHPLSIDTSNPNDWVISNGALVIDFYPPHASIIDMHPVGSAVDFVDQTQTSGGVPKGFYMDNAGLGSAVGQPGYQLTKAYLDWWVTYPSGSTNNFTYSEHWVVTPNDMGVHVYLAANHSTTDPTGSIGQVQWVFRLDLNQFQNLYMVNEDLSNPEPVSIGPLPTYAEYFGTINPDGLGPADKGRAVQDATVDLHGYGQGPWSDFPPISEEFGRQFGDKYDYSGYNYLNLCHGVFGTHYGAWVVMPSNESLVGGPTKQMLLFTGNLDMIEAYSNHFDNGISLTVPAGAAYQRLFGPFYVRFNQIDGDHIRNAHDMYRDAVRAGTHMGHVYDHEKELLASG